MVNFNFPEKDLGLVSPPHFMYDFSRKIFLMLYSVKWPTFIVWLPLLLEILDNITCCPVYDVINFEINHIFLIKSLFQITKKSGQKYEYLKNEKSYQYEIFLSFLRGFIKVNKNIFLE